MATTRSFRTSQLSECCSHDAGRFDVEAEVEADQRTRLAVHQTESGRTRSVNGTSSSLTDHLKVLPVVAWTASEGVLLGGPPEGRRRFVDQGIVSSRPAALEVLGRYRRALSQKRQLLAQGGGVGLEAWNEVLAGESSALMTLRREYLGRLSATVAEVNREIGLDLPAISLRYLPSIRGGDDRGHVYAELEAVRSRELAESRPLIGPHRDEVEIRWGDHLIKRVGSAGERKVLGLLISAARGRVLATAGRLPLFLLDDADSELDGRRLEAIWELFRGFDQVFISSNRSSVWKADSEARRWRLESGSLSSD